MKVVTVGVPESPTFVRVAFTFCTVEGFASVKFNTNEILPFLVSCPVGVV
ncbi:MAG: hypothetical protein K6A43_12250 [Treponema sp.]|nr:hypothetical protein [Treponema sp.]